MPERYIAVVLGVILAPLVTIKDISVFASCHIIADVFIMFSSFAIVIYSIFFTFQYGVASTVKPFTSIYSAVKIFGLTTGAYEINAVLISIYKQARTKQDYHQAHCPAIISAGLLYFTIGVFGYIAFGVAVKGPVTLSMDQTLWYIEMIELAYIAALLPTILIQIHPAIQIISHYTTDKLIQGQIKELIHIVIRVIIIIFPICLAIKFGESFEGVLAFIGSLVCAPVSYVFPGVIHYCIAAETKQERVRDIMLILFGLSCFSIATGLTIVGTLKS
jgi:proton-coupled amino acid transporter